MFCIRSVNNIAYVLIPILDTGYVFPRLVFFNFCLRCCYLLEAMRRIFQYNLNQMKYNTFVNDRLNQECNNDVTSCQG